MHRKCRKSLKNSVENKTEDWQWKWEDYHLFCFDELDRIWNSYSQ